MLAIDLGSSTSCMAVLAPNGPCIVPNREGSRTTPTVVAAGKRGAWLVGHRARWKAALRPLDSYADFLHLLGRRFDAPEVQALLPGLPYEVVEGKSGDACVRLGSEPCSPVELCAAVLADLKEIASECSAEPLTEALIAVPAMFNRSQRQAVEDAASIAGLSVERVMQDCDAVALGFKPTRRRGSKLAVVNVGGGSFSIALYAVDDGVYHALATAGDTGD